MKKFILLVSLVFATNCAIFGDSDDNITTTADDQPTKAGSGKFCYSVDGIKDPRALMAPASIKEFSTEQFKADSCDYTSQEARDQAAQDSEKRCLASGRGYTSCQINSSHRE